MHEETTSAMTHISGKWAKVRQVEFKSCSVVLHKEEDPNLIMTLSIPIYDFPLQIFCFVDWGIGNWGLYNVDL